MFWYVSTIHHSDKELPKPRDYFVCSWLCYRGLKWKFTSNQLTYLFIIISACISVYVNYYHFNTLFVFYYSVQSRLCLRPDRSMVNELAFSCMRCTAYLPCSISNKPNSCKNFVIIIRGLYCKKISISMNLSSLNAII